MDVGIGLMHCCVWLNTLKVLVQHRIAREEMWERGKNGRIPVALGGVDNSAGQAQFCVLTIALVRRIFGRMAEYVHWRPVAQNINVVVDGNLFFEVKRHLAAQHLEEYINCAAILQQMWWEHRRLGAVDAIALIPLPVVQLGHAVKLGNDAELGDVVLACIKLDRIHASPVALMDNIF